MLWLTHRGRSPSLLTAPRWGLRNYVVELQLRNQSFSVEGLGLSYCLKKNSSRIRVKLVARNCLSNSNVLFHEENKSHSSLSMKETATWKRTKRGSKPGHQENDLMPRRVLGATRLFGYFFGNEKSNKKSPSGTEINIIELSQSLSSAPHRAIPAFHESYPTLVATAA